MTKIIAFDPGKTTGVCVISVSDNLFLITGHLQVDLPALTEMLVSYEPYHTVNAVFVVESVVARGLLTTAKFTQICAFDRIRCFADLKVVPLHIISPEARKRHNIVVPTEVKGRHARDAYRLALVYAIKEGIYVPTNPNPEA